MENRFHMFRQRIIVTTIIIPLAVIAIYFGNYIYQITIITLLVVAAWEYIKLLKKIGFEPSVPIILIGVVALSVIRSLFQFNYGSATLTMLLFGTAAYHIFQYERKDSNPAADFSASLSVILYIGFLGPYLISLRSLPDGMWWTFLVLPIVWIADSGAYLIGSAFGKRKLAAKTSPNKTWEGYFGGILFGILGGIGLSALYQSQFNAGIDLTPLKAGILGLIISTFIPLGDLTESMIKRQASSKDSGTLFPGHGGIFDRLDSLFWAAPIGYYIVLHIFL